MLVLMSDYLPPSDKAQHADHNEEQHRQHEQGDGRAMRHVAGDDADLESLEPQYGGRIHGATLGQEVDDRKVGEREYDPEDQAYGDDRKDHRQDDLIVAAPEAGAIDCGGVDDILRDRGDAGEKDNDREWKKAPA